MRWFFTFQRGIRQLADAPITSGGKRRAKPRQLDDIDPALPVAMPKLASVCQRRRKRCKAVHLVLNLVSAGLPLPREPNFRRAAEAERV